VHAAAAAAAPRERHVERFLGQARAELRVGELGAPRLERALDLLLRRVESRAGRSLLLYGKIFQSGLELRKLARLAQEAGLGVLERRGVARRGEIAERTLDDFFQGVNG
jgi:hypothetical protein